MTGASGLLGRRVVPSAVAAGWSVVAPSSDELDVRDELAIARWVDTTAPIAIAHLAYRKHERRTIVDGSIAVARAAARSGARLVHMSTDAVFAGRDESYTEHDQPTPVHDYGRWKAAAEDGVAEHADAAVVVRTSLMYTGLTGAGPMGAGADTAPCEADVRRVLDGDTDMQFFTDEVRCFTHVDDVATAVVALAGRTDVRGVLHVAAPDPIDRAEFARRVAMSLGRDPAEVPTATIADSGLERPGRVVLDTARAASLGIACRPLDATFPTR